MKGDIHSLRNDEEAGNLGTGLCLDVAVYAAGTAPVTRILDRETVGRTLFCKEVDVAFIADKGWHADSAAHAFQGFYHQLHRGALVDTYGYRVVRQMGILGCFQKQIGKFVGCISSVALYAADGPVVPLCHTGILGTVCLTGYTVDLHALAAHDL